MPRLSRRLGPVGLALTAWDIWRRLPPKQRKQVLNVARKHGPKVASKVLQGKRAGADAPREEALGRSESGADDAVLLAQVRGGIALARARAPGPADVAQRDPCRFASSSRCRIVRHAPMFCGSSCAHTTSRRFG